MSRDFLSIVRGPGGGVEVTRAISALGGLVYCLVAIVVAIRTDATLTEFCLQFPVGLAAILAAAAGGAVWRDKGSASAKIIEQTGHAPGKGEA